MIDPDEMKELDRWVEVTNKSNGYASAFNRRTEGDKAIVQIGTAREWCRSVAAEFGLSVGEPEHNPADPPDCLVSVDGKCRGVELTELVEEEHKHRAIRGESPYSKPLFLDAQWSKDRLVEKLSQYIQVKGEKYKINHKLIDVLVIHTDEPFLTSDQARGWLSDLRIEPHHNIANVFLLFTYEPGRGVEHWPLLRLYGDLGGVG